MDILPYIYLGYMFISLYFLSLYFLLYFRNKKELFGYAPITKKYSVSFLVPAYNEEKTLGETIEHIFNIDYDNILEVIVINDKSSDNTLNIANSLKQKYPKLIVLDNLKNLGKAGSLNRALEIAKGELIAVVDADSYPAKESLNKMIGFFDEESVGAVTCPIIARNNSKFFEKLQSYEYKVIAFTRKLLDYVDAIYVTPGPLALYRKIALIDINGFDSKNITEDIEATWHLTHNGWKRKMSLSTSVSSTVPNKFIAWYRQRRRWNVGGLQCIYKYRKSLGKKGMLGWFIIPFFISSTFLGLVGLSIFAYLTVRNMISNYLFTKYSINAGTSILTIDDLLITPSILNYLGIVLFILGAVFTFLILALLKEEVLKKQNVFNILIYLIVYLTLYPFIMLSSIWHAIRKKRIWR
jgi:cellulose synthase/poly-beta-1,6-N-acetylglucosamine synthase-like glycosyltransferase